MRYTFYSLKLSPCETWLQGWIHFWRYSHRSQLAYGRWHRERRKRIKDGGRRATKENELFFSRPQATFLTTILSKANNCSEYQNFKLICSWLFLFWLRTITFHSAQKEHTFTKHRAESTQPEYSAFPNETILKFIHTKENHF